MQVSSSEMVGEVVHPLVSADAPEFQLAVQRRTPRIPIRGTNFSPSDPRDKKLITSRRAGKIPPKIEQRREGINGDQGENQEGAPEPRGEPRHLVDPVDRPRGKQEFDRVKDPGAPFCCNSRIAQCEYQRPAKCDQCQHAVFRQGRGGWRRSRSQSARCCVGIFFGQVSLAEERPPSPSPHGCTHSKEQRAPQSSIRLTSASVFARRECQVARRKTASRKTSLRKAKAVVRVPSSTLHRPFLPERIAISVSLLPEYRPGLFRSALG